MVRSIRGTFEFNQPYKLTESKMQVTEKISSNKQNYVTLWMFRQVIQCKKKKQRQPTQKSCLANFTNETAMCSLILKNSVKNKILFKNNLFYGYIRPPF